MSSTYLSLRASDVPAQRALRFERGQPMLEFSLGRRGVWQTSAPGASDRQLWIGFDGECVVLRRDAESPPVSVDGQPLPLGPQRITRLPCRIELGGAELLVDERAPAFAALDAGALRLTAPGLSSAKSAARPFEAVAVARCVAVHGAVGAAPRAPAPSRGGDAAQPERMIDDGHATSVMPLDVMLQRGLIPAPRAREPAAAPQRRRRALEPRRRGAARSLSIASIGARAGRWLARRPGESWPGWMRERWFIGLTLSMLLPFCYALSPSSSAPATAGFEATARGGSAAARSTTREPAPRAGASAARDDARSAAASAPAAPPPADDGRFVARPPGSAAAADREPSAAARVARERARAPSRDARTTPTAERLAVDAFAAGDQVRARALYAALAERAPGDPALAEAARILSAQRAEPPLERDRAGSERGDGANGGAAHVR